MRRSRRVGLFLVVLLLSWLVTVGCGAATKPVAWEPIGLSGMGGMYAPAISPVNPKLMMVNCDMSAAYISRDGGQNWKMIHHSQLRASTRCRPAFHPTDVNVIFAAQYGAGLKVSRDGGEHWESVKGVPAQLTGEVGIDPGHPDRMMVGDRAGVWLSLDGGKTWSLCEGPRGEAVGFHFDQTSPADQRVCFAATSEGIWRSDDGGRTWAPRTKGLPWTEVKAFCGGSKAVRKLVVLYCSVTSKVENGRFAGGVFRSSDRGESWQSVMGGGINMDTQPADEWPLTPIAQYIAVLTTDADPNIVYAVNTGTGVLPPHHTGFYRSADAGKTWRATFYPDPRFKEFNVEADFMTTADKQFYQSFQRAAIDNANPDHVLQVMGRLYTTTDGGKTWKCGHTRRARDSSEGLPQWLCNGLVVTTTWNYYVDPFQPNRHYIAYTDIGLGRSLDAGKTWTWWGDSRSPWINTCYELAFDPKTPGKIWGAFSNTHDIPNGNIIGNYHRDDRPGGICVSTDFGRNWTVSNKGLPASACVSVVVDPKSPAGRRTLYASMFNNGVYKSTDDGRTWAAASEGLGAPTNMRTCRLVLHEDGTLFVVITARRDRQTRDFLPEGVGLYRSTDGAKSWERINRSQPLSWPKDFTVDPTDSKVIYVGACDTRESQQGGLYRTTDGGQTWKRLAREGSQHFGAYLHPKHPGWIYMTLCEGAPGSGLWLSKDNGETFKPLNGLPFSNVQRVLADPADDAAIYVTTFGGSVWHGPAEE